MDPLIKEYKNTMFEIFSWGEELAALLRQEAEQATATATSGRISWS